MLANGTNPKPDEGADLLLGIDNLFHFQGMV